MVRPALGSEAAHAFSRAATPRISPSRARRSRSTNASARTLFCTLARVPYRQLRGLVQRPSETGAVIAHIGRCWSGDKATPGAFYDSGLFRPKILPKLAVVKLGEIAKTASYSKASRVGHREWEADAACLDVGGASQASWSRPPYLNETRTACSKTPASTRVTGDFLSSLVSFSIKMPTDAAVHRELVGGRAVGGRFNEKGHSIKDPTFGG